MSRTSSVVVLFLVASFMISPSQRPLCAVEPAVVAMAPVKLTTVEENLVHYTNLQRKRHGLPPLEASHALMQSSRKHARWMTRAGSLTHARQNVGENIAMGQSTSQEAVKAWMASPGHRANMLSRSYRSIGAAAYRTSAGTIYWCLQFQR